MGIPELGLGCVARTRRKTTRLSRSASLAPLALALLIAGCATAPQRELSRAAPEGVYVQGGRIPFKPKAQDPYSDQGGLIAVLERKHGRPLQILELSGGGQYGAFGAGFLNGDHIVAIEDPIRPWISRQP